ncbi:hypothetical protein CEV32_3645 [Brucella rhizosphaerae]|uniref:Uncharacterized protein n=1 Tax=Brucella rhizosphaerae TaxID=571254 RepID=A0A256FSH8_9HYPH|nr:hypothetical protein CEV32_3645 [Brucella rhizosphaerae]
MPGAGVGYDSFSRRKTSLPIVIHIPGYVRLLHAPDRFRRLMRLFLMSFRGFK